MGKEMFCHICRKKGHLATAHKKTYEDTRGPTEGFTGRAFHGKIEGSIFDGTLRRKR